MTKNPNPRLFIVSFFVFVRRGEGAGAGLGRARGGVGKGVRAIIFICGPLYQLNIHPLRSHEDIP